MVDKNAVEDFLLAIQPQDKKTDHTYNATVTRVDDNNMVWVQVAGSDKETPTESTSSEVKRGDAVNVQWRNNKLYIAGNYTNPSAGTIRVAAVESAARVANQAASNAVADAGIARQAAEDAQTAATQAQSEAATAKNAADNASEYAARALGNLSTVQSVTETLNWITQHGTMALTTDVALDPTHVYFVQDAGGDYVVGGVTYAVVTEPDVDDIATYYVLSIDESLNNYVGTHLALTSEGLWLIPEAGGNKVLIATGGVGHTYEDAGTYIIDENDNVLAQFLESGLIIGPSDATHMEIVPMLQRIFSYDGTTPIVEMGAVKTYSQSETCFTFGTRRKATNDYDPSSTYVEGQMVSYGGYDYVCVERISAPEQWTPSHWRAYVGEYSFAQGRYNTAAGTNSHAEGYTSMALGNYSHAENNGQAYAESSHAEGDSTTDGKYAHAEGDSYASGHASHAEGDSYATGDYSHGQNLGTTARKKAQTAIGTYNIPDTVAGGTHPSGDIAYGTYAAIIGNGTADNAQSNALTVDWLGNVSALGSLFTGMADEWAKKGANHIVIAGYHVCWGVVAVTPTANAYAETEVTLPYTYTSHPTAFASPQARSGQVRTVYANQSDTQTGDKLYVGIYRTNTTVTNVAWLTIGV